MGSCDRGRGLGSARIPRANDESDSAGRYRKTRRRYSFYSKQSATIWLRMMYCRQHGLAATRQVKVVTKRDGTTEIKGLEVLYLEKFFASDAKAKPLQFRGFSSPAVDELAPGRYLFWAKEPGVGGKNGNGRKQELELPVPATP